MSQNDYKYFAFISYRHTDIAVAKRLQRLLESYRLPSSLKARKGMPKRFRIFRDQDELTSGVLSEELRKKLDESKFLIVICSPESAKSRYVGEEIAYFQRLGRERRIIPFIISGKPHDSRFDCFHPQLSLGGHELLGIDIQAEAGVTKSLRFHKAFIRLVAKMLDLDFDTLWNKRRRRLLRQISFAAVASALLGGCIAMLATRLFAERPFDAQFSFSLPEAERNLPIQVCSPDSIFIEFDEGDQRGYLIVDLSSPIEVKNIPGRYRDKAVSVKAAPFGFFPVDTILPLSRSVVIPIRRDPDTFGRILYNVVDSDWTTPVVGAVFDFGCVRVATDSTGLLDAMIPLPFQSSRPYAPTVTHYGRHRSIAFSDSILPILDRTDPPTIMLNP